MTSRRFVTMMPIGCSLAALALTVGATMWHTAHIGDTMLSSTAALPSADDVTSSVQHAHERMMTTYQQRIDGRSLFFDPHPLERVDDVASSTDERDDQQELEIIVEEPVDTPLPLPGPPATYQGPTPQAIVADAVWFPETRAEIEGYVNDPLRIRVGESHDGLEVVKIIDGQTVRLRHRGGEYDVPIFGRGHDVFGHAMTHDSPSWRLQTGESS
ncbi:MAG: hypothetical protein AAF432_04750 [Planctomycetota bacterium]